MVVDAELQFLLRARCRTGSQSRPSANFSDVEPPLLLKLSLINKQISIFLLITFEVFLQKEVPSDGGFD